MTGVLMGEQWFSISEVGNVPDAVAEYVESCTGDLYTCQAPDHLPIIGSAVLHGMGNVGGLLS